MCGFTTYHGVKENNITTLQEAYQNLKHRGNDEYNIFRKQFKNTDFHFLDLIHTRLILNGEKNNGTQPFIFNKNESQLLEKNALSDKTKNNYYCVINGEFYNYKEIAKSENVILKTGSDSELLLHLYQKYGVNCLKFLEGEFAFSFYDEKEKIWFCARDRFGCKPLHYTFNENYFITSSEAKGIFPLLKEIKQISSNSSNSSYQPEIDLESLMFSQQFQYLPMGKTLFKNIQIIPPSHYLIFKENTKQIELTEYWNPLKPSIEIYNEEEMAFLLKDAVNKRIKDLDLNKTKTCVHLSGGLDSSTVAYYARDRIKDAYTISFNQGGVYDELNLAQITAKKLGLNLNVVNVTDEDILDNFEKSIYFSEGLTINGHFSSKFLLSQRIHQDGFKVALTGEGSDEIFMGYSHLKQDYLGLSALTQFEKDYLNGYQLDLNNDLNLNNKWVNKLLDNLNHEDKMHIQNIMKFNWIKAKMGISSKLSHYWTQDFKHQFSQNNINLWGNLINTHLHYLNKAKENETKNLNHYLNSPLKQSSLLWQKYCLGGYILKTLDDGLGMANAVESRLSFLDSKLVEYVFNLKDENYFHKNGMEKVLLRNLMKEKLPNEIIDKTKQSFMSPPVSLALKNPSLLKKIKDILLNDVFVKNTKSLFNHQLIEKNLNNGNIKEPELMMLMSVASLYKQFNLK